MDRKLRNRISLLLLLAVVVAVGLIKLSGRKPAPKISAVTPVRENLISSISSNGKVEPIAPYVMRAELDTFVEKVYASEGQQVKKGQLLLELDVKDAAARLAETRAKLLQAERQLTDDAGLPKRPWYRHMLYAPGYYTGYAVKTMPGVREAIEQKEYAEAEREIARVAKALEREAALLDSISASM